jgi:alkylresorcinol/alkylpyrone synthase
MPKIISVGEGIPHFELSQELTVEFANELFKDSFKDINRLLQVFENGKIKKRHFVNNLSWFEADHTFEEKNDSYINSAVTLGVEAIERCLTKGSFLNKSIPYNEIDALFFISSTGISTPSIDARIMNKLPFSPHLKRIPIWGLGCAGGASGLSRAFEYCKAFPGSKVLVLSVELCSLTFQRNDFSKSNLIGTSLFADGVACACIVGDKVNTQDFSKLETFPYIMDTQSTLMKDSEEVMGWDVKNEGLYVIFSKDIPTIIESWLAPNVSTFLSKHQLQIENIDYFVAHPGGKKVLDAYKNALGIKENMTRISNEVLREYGNMSSATVLYVLKKFMLSQDVKKGGYGLAAALGPGFSSELLLLHWE